MITESHLKLLIRIHKIEPIQGKVLCLGRQRVNLDQIEVERIFVNEGLSLHPNFEKSLTNPEKVDEKCPSPEGKLSDHQLFAAFGIDEVHSIDVSDFEGANLIHDLNFEIPSQYEGKFDFIVDGGTFDHLVDIKTAFQNLIRLLSENGRTFMWNASSNFNPLVYMSFSPEFFYDYFIINKFKFCKTCLAEINTACQGEWWDLYQFKDWLGFRRLYTSFRPLMVLIYAKKQPQSTYDKIPIQSYYRTHVDYELNEDDPTNSSDPFVGVNHRRSLSEWMSYAKAFIYLFKRISVKWKGRL